jgi:hypothetical protein
MKALAAVLAGVGAMFCVPSFADNNVLVGTGLGAALGAVVGHQVDHNNGAWVGGAVGAVTGAAIASSNNNTRYVERDPYGYDTYSTYNAPRRDVYVVEREYYQRPYRRPPVNVIVVDDDDDHRGHRNHHRHERHHHGGQGYYNQGRNDGRTVVIMR